MQPVTKRCEAKVCENIDTRCLQRPKGHISGNVDAPNGQRKTVNTSLLNTGDHLESPEKVSKRAMTEFDKFGVGMHINASINSNSYHPARRKYGSVLARTKPCAYKTVYSC